MFEMKTDWSALLAESNEEMRNGVYAHLDRLEAIDEQNETKDETAENNKGLPI